MEKESESNSRNFLFLSLNKSEEYIHLDDYGILFENHLCSLFNLNGKINLSNREQLSSAEKRLFICSDICSTEAVINGGIKLPALREISFKADGETVDTNLSNLLWLEVKNKRLKKLRLFLLNALGQEPSLKSCTLNCTILTFKKN